MSVLTLRVVKSGSIGSIDTFKVQQRKFIFWVDFKEGGVVRTFDSLVLANMYAQLKARSMKGKFIDRKIKSNVV
jgi:hypothetical protein